MLIQMEKNLQLMNIATNRNMWKGKIFTKNMVDDGDLDIIKSNLDLINVDYHIKNNILYFDEIEISKLPKDSYVPYVPYDELSGYSLYTITDNDLN